MKLLLDTHTALWMFAGSSRIGPALQSVLTDAGNEVFFSDASAWEIVIKHSLGKLPLPQVPDLWVPRMVEQHLLGSLPIDRDAVFRWGTLPPIHRFCARCQTPGGITTMAGRTSPNRKSLIRPNVGDPCRAS